MSVVIWDEANPYSYVEVRGEVVETIAGSVARDHIDELSQKYRGGPYQIPVRSERVILKIDPTRQRA